MNQLPQPSDLFVGAILEGYQYEVRAPRRPVTASAIWDHVVVKCLNAGVGGFAAMFAWDTRKGKQNRIGTIIEVIEAGYVPGLVIRQDGRAKFVERAA